MNGQDLDAAINSPAKDDQDCMLCALPWWECVCSRLNPQRMPTAVDLEASRADRLARAERKGGGE